MIIPQGHRLELDAMAAPSGAPALQQIRQSMAQEGSRQAVQSEAAMVQRQALANQLLSSYADEIQANAAGGYRPESKALAMKMKEAGVLDPSDLGRSAMLFAGMS